MRVICLLRCLYVSPDINVSAATRYIVKKKYLYIFLVILRAFFKNVKKNIKMLHFYKLLRKL
jgi:hypothetical protein